MKESPVKRKCYESVFKRKVFSDGDDSGEDPPVPIPNTEVKLSSVDNTWLVTAWKDRVLPSYRDIREKAFLLSLSHI